MGFIIFIFILYLIIKGSNNSRNMSSGNQRSNLISVRCPHCQSDISIEHNGGWNCPDCGKVFYYNNGEVSKDEIECNDFLLSIVSLLAKVAKADGVVTKNEISVVNSLLTDMLELNKSQLKQAADKFNLSKTSYDNYIAYVKEIITKLERKNMQNDDVYGQIVEMMYAVADADGEVSSEQQKIIDYAVSSFNLRNDDHERIKSKYVKDIDKYYKILNCSRSSSDAEIKSSYRKLLLEYHPDKFYSKDLPQEMMDFAKEKTQQIQNAYEIIRKERKF